MSTTTASPATARAPRVLEPARSASDVTRHVEPMATLDEIKASTCSCVVHLCGCS
jgi:hypothetical protein